MYIKKLELKGTYLLRFLQFPDNKGWITQTYSWPMLRKEGFLQPFLYEGECMIPYKNTFRGFHFQKEPRAASMLVRCVRGKVLVVVVDMKKSSDSYKQYEILELSDTNNCQIITEKGFAHAFLSLEDDTFLQFKMDEPYDSLLMKSFCWNDPQLGIVWPEKYQLDPSKFIISVEDQMSPTIDLCDCNY